MLNTNLPKGLLLSFFKNICKIVHLEKHIQILRVWVVFEVLGDFPSAIFAKTVPFFKDWTLPSPKFRPLYYRIMRCYISHFQEKDTLFLRFINFKLQFLEVFMCKSHF